MQPQLSVLVVLVLLSTTFCFGQQPPQQRNWYYLNNPSETERSSALNAGCYHGQYGPITLLSCPFPNAQFLVTLPSTTYICAVQTKFLEEDFAMVLSEGNPLLNIDDWYLLTSELDYACLDASESRSLRITVSPTAWKIPKKNQSSKVINITAVDPFIESLLDQVEASNIYQSIVTLSNIHTRQAQSTGAREAQNYLAETFRSYGFTVTTHTFQSGYTDNVIAELRGTTSPDEIVVVGAHYDSRSTDRFSTTQRAPGADDNASGTATNLELARVIYQNGVQFEKTLRILAFSGEEQGLLGSRAYANFIANRGDNVVAMFNGDMTGYFPDLDGTPITVTMLTRFIDPQLLAAANAITQQYLPELAIGTTTGCCSDQQSFTEAGYPAVGYFESEYGASSYPGYHNGNDLPGLLNVEQLGLIGKSIIASTLTYAQAYSGEEIVS